MNRYIIGSLWDRANRNGTNKNFEYLFEGSKRIDALNSRADGILNKSNATLNEAQKTNVMNRDVQEQINVLIAESGTSDAEVLQARVSSTGNTFTTLKERLDNNEEKTAIYLSDYGVSHTSSARENTIGIKQAIAAAKVTNRPLIFPWTPIGEHIDVDETIVIDAAITLQGHGVNTSLRQTIDGLCVFDACNSKVKIEGFSLSGINGKTHGGIRVTNDDIVINDVSGKGLFWVVRVISFDIINNKKRSAVKNVRVTNLTSDYSNFGLLVEGSENIYFDNIRGTYALISGRMPHLIYFSNGAGEMGLPLGEPIAENISPLGVNCMSWDSGSSYAYQFKNVTGGIFNNLHARNCFGLMNLMHVRDTRIKSCSSIDDQNTQDNYGSIEMDGVSDNVIIDDVFVENTAGGKIARMGGEVTNSEIKHLDAITYNKVESSSLFSVQLSGDNNKLFKPSVVNKNEDNPWYCSIGIFSGNNHIIEDPYTKGNSIGVHLKDTGSGHKLIDYSIENLGVSKLKQWYKPLEVQSPSAELMPKITQDVVRERGRTLAYDKFDKMFGSLPALFSTTSGSLYEFPFGTWHISDNKAYATIGGGAIALIDVKEKNVEFSCGLKYANREKLIIRGSGRNTNLAARLNHVNNTVEIVKQHPDDGSVDVVIESAPFDPQVGRRYKMKIQIYGDKIDCFVDDRLIVTHKLNSTDSEKFKNYTKVGMMMSASTGAMFDNLEVKTLE